jgi:hypothetical protein
VVLIRFPAPARQLLPEAVLDLVARYSERLLTSFVVLKLGRVRIGSLPTWPMPNANESRSSAQAGQRARIIAGIRGRRL